MTDQARTYDPREYLTPQQQRCVEAYMQTSNQAKAAEAAGYKGNVAQLSVRGGKVVRSQHGAAYLKLLAAATMKKDGTLETVEQRRAWLTKRIEDDALPMGERLRAMDMLCKTCGDYVMVRREEGETKLTIEVVRREGAAGGLNIKDADAEVLAETAPAITQALNQETP